MKTILTLIILLVITLCDAQNPLFKKYIGQEHRSISEFEDFSDYKDFGGMMIGSDSLGREFGFSRYGNKEGQVVVFETVKTVNRKGVYTLIDAILVNNLDTNQYLLYGQCSLNDEENSFIVVVYEEEPGDNEFYTNILKAWRANPKSNCFDAIGPDNIKCFNEGFGCMD